MGDAEDGRARQEAAIQHFLEQEERPAAKPPPTPTSVAAPPMAAQPGLTRTDTYAIYAHLLRTLGWMLFWFSAFGGIAAAVTFWSTNNRLDYPLAVAAAIVWGTLGAAVAASARADLRRLRR